MGSGKISLCEHLKMDVSLTLNDFGYFCKEKLTKTSAFRSANLVETYFRNCILQLLQLEEPPVTRMEMHGTYFTFLFANYFENHAS